MFTLQIMFI